MIRRGVVLAGGASRRMGRDKALMAADAGRTMVEHAVDRLAPICDEVVVASGSARLLTGFRNVPDGPGRGPGAGILGASDVADGRSAPGRPDVELLVLACDLPAVPGELLRRLTDFDRSFGWVVPRWSRGLEPLCALYRPGALAALRRRFERQRFALHDIDIEVASGYLEGDALQSIGRPEKMFLNVNSLSDFEIWATERGKDSIKAESGGA